MEKCYAAVDSRILVTEMISSLLEKICKQRTDKILYMRSLRKPCDMHVVFRCKLPALL